ncbi:MAG: hypothetical protein WB421_13975 [Terriglobales bacterium]
MYGSLGPMKTTYSKYTQNPDHKRKTGPLNPEAPPEPKKSENVLVQMTPPHPPGVQVTNDIRTASNNGIIETVTQGLPSMGPVKTGIDDKYLVFVIGCVVLYLYTTHAPDRFRFIST